MAGGHKPSIKLRKDNSATSSGIKLPDIKLQRNLAEESKSFNYFSKKNVSMSTKQSDIRKGIPPLPTNYQR